MPSQSQSKAATGRSPSVADHFAGRSPAVRQIYDRLLQAARRLGPVAEDPKKTSIHLNRKTAFAGVATRKEALVLTLKMDGDVASPRVHRRERVSAKRWHLEVKLDDPAQVDRELVSWLERSYSLSG